MDVFKAIETRASVREYVPCEIPEEDLLRIVDAGRRAPSGSNRQPCEFILVTDPKTLKGLARLQPAFATAAAAVGIVADPNTSRWWLEDASAAAENMLLAIHALGYASVWVEGTLLREYDFARDLLDVPEDKRFQILLPIGKAPAAVPQADKKPLDEVLHRETYGAR
jgi:nitroreductase